MDLRNGDGCMAAHLKKWQIERNVANEIAPRLGTNNIVQFDALECRVFGQFGGVAFGPYDAVSGAGLNSPSDLKGASFSIWTPAKGKTGNLAGQRGGVIPPGLWIILPEVLSKGAQSRCMKAGGATGGGAPTNGSLKLVPYSLEQEHLGEAEPRQGFYIHGASLDPSKAGTGSDGCILMNKLDRHWLATQVMAARGAWLIVTLNRKRLNEMRQFQNRTRNYA